MAAALSAEAQPSRRRPGAASPPPRADAGAHTRCAAAPRTHRCCPRSRSLAGLLRPRRM